MWQYNNASPDRTRPDIERFLSHLNTQAADFFASDQPLLIARAPGRLDLMGGIADYSGSLVLEMPLAVATIAAVQRTNDPTITVYSTSHDITEHATVTLPLASLREQDQPISYAAARTLLTTDPDTAWVAYVIGVLVILQHEYHLKLEQGLRIMVHCEVPIGKGVSSSAALEVATMQVLKELYQLDLNRRELAMLCQKAENLIVGAPCGVMDQMTSACGESNSLLALLCQPAELQGSVPLPDGVEIWGLDSGLSHSVAGADYGSVRIGAFMGYRIISDLMNFAITPLPGRATVEIADPQWQGYLANISPSVWETYYRKRLPLTLDGASFLERYGGTTDSITQIDPRKTYAIRQPTAHPINEHHRVRLFRSLLQTSPATDEQLALLGELMYQSHASYNSCGLGSSGTDRLVELTRLAGPTAQLYGAKITGGGSGGTVAVLARKNTDEAIHAITQQYERETGLKTTILRGSSPGADAWGTLQLTAN
jgi:galactokinase